MLSKWVSKAGMFIVYCCTTTLSRTICCVTANTCRAEPKRNGECMAHHLVTKGKAILVTILSYSTKAFGNNERTEADVSGYETHE